MKHTVMIAAIAAAGLAGCSTTQPTKQDAILGVDQPTFMQRTEVISATHECEAAGMRPRMVYAYQTIQGKRVPVPIDVYCEPAFRRPPSAYSAYQQ